MAYNNITWNIFRYSVVEVFAIDDTVILWVSTSAEVCVPVKVGFTTLHYLHGIQATDSCCR